MPAPSFSPITGTDLDEILNSLEKQRKELNWLLTSLDTSNVKELNADVINAGKIKAEFIQIGAGTDFEDGFDPSVALQEAQEALTAAGVAQGSANTANNQIQLWKYEDTTLIDGGSIFTNTITANKLQVVELSSITANLGTINAGTINGIQINSANISVQEDVEIGRYLVVGKGFDTSSKGITFKGTAASINVFGDTMTFSASDLVFSGSVSGLYARFG